jgi:predicted DCC family thiol-disulfide oxidoreductase YuxK
MQANPALMELTDHPVLFFDGVCNLCNGFIDFLVKRDRNRQFRFAPLQGETARYALPEGLTKDLNSLVLAEEGELYFRSTAALRTIAKLGGIWSIAGALLWVPTGLRDSVYRWVAANRYRWRGKRDTCRLPTPEERELFMP